MSWRKSFISIVFLLFSALVCAAQGQTEKQESVSRKTWSCPKGWDVFTNVEGYECVWASLTATNSYEKADASCKALDSSLVTIQSEEKWNFVKELFERSDKESAWMALRKETYRTTLVRWQTRRGAKLVSFKPYGFEPNSGYYSENQCVVMDSSGYWRYRSCTSNYRMFICEKHIECQSGYFGGRCDKQCHCHGQACNSSRLNVTCDFGCLPGWMGNACDIKREKASVAYHCIHSGNTEGHVSIEIDTKGIMYRHIQAIDDKDTAYSWCNDTKIYMPQPDKFVNINIRVTDKALAEMKEGRCAGQQVEGALYEWRIVLQEWEGIFMPDDQVVLVRCNFSDAETLSRSGRAKVSGKMASVASESEETKENVTLEVADAATEGKLVSTFVGAPVILKVQFGLNKGSLVKSIFPYDCEATTADGAQRLRLLDSYGCQVEGSPVQPFVHTNINNTIVTPWFRYFTFNGYSEVFFQCSFIFCYDTSCGVGCGNQTDLEKGSRYMRSTNSGF